MPILPKLIVPPYDAQPLSRQMLATTAVIYNGADGLNITPGTIAAGAALKTGVIFAPGFDWIEIDAETGGAAPNNNPLGIAIVHCNEASAEIVEETLGQIAAGVTQTNGVVRAPLAGLYLFKLKFYGVDGPTNLHNVRWLKLTKQ